MNKFKKAQEILKEINGDGWLIICNEDNDINSKFLLGVESHALHFIFVSTDGKHKVLAVEMEANMIRRSLSSRGIKADIISYNSLKDLIPKLKPVINRPKVALNFGENIFDPDGTLYADYLQVGAFFAMQKLAPNTKFISAAPIIYNLRSVKSQEELKDLRNISNHLAKRSLNITRAKRHGRLFLRPKTWSYWVSTPATWPGSNAWMR